jgi:hypothetical protein
MTGQASTSCPKHVMKRATAGEMIVQPAKTSREAPRFSVLEVRNKVAWLRHHWFKEYQNE